jgi:putative endonuclease
MEHVSRERISFEKNRLEQRRSRYRSGHWAEVFAGFALRLKGYRILARRKKTPAGEIDLIALRGGTIAFVEVKRRKTLEGAKNAITSKQTRRTLRAAETWLKSCPRYRDYHQRFDAVLVLPKRWPIHLENYI